MLRKLLIDLDSDLKRYNNTLSRFGMLLNPRFLPVIILRFSHFFYRVSVITRPISYFLQWLNIIFFGIECTPKCDIGPGILLPHTVGTVIGASKIGSNVTIFQGVTLGAEFPDMKFTNSLRPVIGNDVIIGSGAKILGNVFIEDCCQISSNKLIFSKKVL